MPKAQITQKPYSHKMTRYTIIITSRIAHCCCEQQAVAQLSCMAVLEPISRWAQMGDQTLKHIYIYMNWISIHTSVSFFSSGTPIFFFERLRSTPPHICSACKWTFALPAIAGSERSQNTRTENVFVFANVIGHFIFPIIGRIFCTIFTTLCFKSQNKKPQTNSWLHH